MEQSLVTNVAQMNWVIIFAVSLLAASLALALYRVAVGSSLGPHRAKDQKSLIEPLDILAFNNLIDPDEEKFLRENLDPSVFHTVQRMRLRAAIEYVTFACRNAAVLIRMGKAMSSGAGTQQSRQAQDLVTAAVHLRLLSILVLCLLLVKIAFPSLRLSLKEVSALHERLVLQQLALSRFRSADGISHRPNPIPGSTGTA